MIDSRGADIIRNKVWHSTWDAILRSIEPTIYNTVRYNTHNIPILIGGGNNIKTSIYSSLNWDLLDD